MTTPSRALLGALCLCLLAACSGADRTPTQASSTDTGSPPSSSPADKTLADLCIAVGGSAALCDALTAVGLSSADFPGVRSVPDLACADDYLATARLPVNPLPFVIVPEDTTGQGGGPAQPEVARALPGLIHQRGPTASFTHEFDFAVHEGRIYSRPRPQTTGVEEAWHEVLLPRCLHGQVSEISADGFVLLAANAQRDIYTLDFGDSGWTRRWGPLFWLDMGVTIPPDVTHWAASELHSGFDEYFVDIAGRKNDFWGILMLYMLRGDGQRITHFDPWLPADESREICPPEEGAAMMEGLSASGSTMMVVTSRGRIYTRLYDFDISGANTVLHDYSWFDQEGVEDYKIQLPAPGWIRHPDVPGSVTNRVSIRKISPGTEHRIMRIEGTDASGNSGFWEKDISELGDEAWHFVFTGEALQGKALPTQGPHEQEVERFDYQGMIAGHPARVKGFRPYCSPATLEIDFGEETLPLTLHSLDGMRQERRAPGLDAFPHYYRSALEVPQDIWDKRDSLSADIQQFIGNHFNERQLPGPMQATLNLMQFQAPCWNLVRLHDNLGDYVTQPPLPDVGNVAAESPLLSALVPELLSSDPDLAAVFPALGEGVLGLGLRPCPVTLP